MIRTGSAVSAVAALFALTAASASGKVLAHPTSGHSAPESAVKASKKDARTLSLATAKKEESGRSAAQKKDGSASSPATDKSDEHGAPPAAPKKDDRSASRAPAKKDEHAKEPARPKVDDASWRPYRSAPWRRGFVTLFGHGKKWSGYLIGPKGHVLPVARSSLSEALASWRTGKELLIDERLIELIARASDEFGGRPIRIVSGYRELSYAPGSKHKVGQAFDFSIPGVPNAALKDYLRTLGDVGVGYYPNSTHVHLDVRDKPTYWVDYSAPGERPMYAYDRRAVHWTARDRAIAAALDALPLRLLASEPASKRELPDPAEDEHEPDASPRVEARPPATKNAPAPAPADGGVLETKSRASADAGAPFSSR